MEIKQIYFKHYILGDIIVNSQIKNEISETIGTVVNDFTKYNPYYYADVIKNNDGTFLIKNFMVVRPESINVGWMNNSKGNKNFINVITNRKAGDDIIIYPSAILSISEMV